MRKKFLTGAALLIAATLAWAASDPWKSKPFSQWTDKDVADILQNSPWARPSVQAQGAWHPDGMTQASGSTSMPGGAGDTSKASASAAPGTASGTEKNEAAAAETQSYSVYWWSSRTIRAASYRRAVLKGSMTQADAEKDLAAVPDDYMVLLQSQNMKYFQTRGEDSFTKDAWLQMKKSKDKVFPTKVGFLKGPDGSVNGVVFYFPKKSANGEPTVAADEKEIDFYFKIGGSKVLTAFDPRKMTDSQGQDL
ncbi:MAG TPA: hypothetical protein VEJ39_03565 [Candidatus Acidoferrales bacterium]|nr:hypothetical protein [Candidatus Acidoferrales bacterium]